MRCVWLPLLLPTRLLLHRGVLHCCAAKQQPSMGPPALMRCVCCPCCWSSADICCGCQSCPLCLRCCACFLRYAAAVNDKAAPTAVDADVLCVAALAAGPVSDDCSAGTCCGCHTRPSSPDAWTQVYNMKLAVLTALVHMHTQSYRHDNRQLAFQLHGTAHLLVEHRLCLTTETGLLAVVTPLACKNKRIMNSKNQ
jgi:hypothetical protein